MPVLISTFVAGLILTPLLYSMGRELVRMESINAALDEFEAAPEDASFTRNWIFGWRFSSQRRVLRGAANALGERLVSGFFRLAGAFFLLVMVALWMAFFFLLVNS